MSCSCRKSFEKDSNLSSMNNSKRVLVTGSQGYVGTELLRKLTSFGYQASGLDTGYFKNSNLDESMEVDSLKRDLRDQSDLDLSIYDCIVHLAALSNDPLGEINPKLTYAINRDSAINLAIKAKTQGVHRFIFASTQSIYGISGSDSELSEDDPKNPITAYAKSKWDAEQEILSFTTNDFTPVSVRPSTIFGWGSRIRNDIVFNNMIASGLKHGKIEVHTDGTPYRPIVHMSDVLDFFCLLITAPSRTIGGQAYNLGAIDGNFTVLEVAESASRCLNNVPIVLNTENLYDQRSYKVSFEKARRDLGFTASLGLHFGGTEIVNQYNKLSSEKREKYFTDTFRLDVLRKSLNAGTLNSDLKWV